MHHRSSTIAVKKTAAAGQRIHSIAIALPRSHFLDGLAMYLPLMAAHITATRAGCVVNNTDMSW